MPAVGGQLIDTSIVDGTVQLGAMGLSVAALGLDQAEDLKYPHLTLRNIFVALVGVTPRHRLPSFPRAGASPGHPPDFQGCICEALTAGGSRDVEAFGSVVAVQS